MVCRGPGQLHSHFKMSSAYSVVDHEPLKPSAVVSKLPDAVQHKVDNFFANGIVTAGKVVCGVFLSCVAGESCSAGRDHKFLNLQATGRWLQPKGKMQVLNLLATSYTPTLFPEISCSGWNS